MREPTAPTLFDVSPAPYAPGHQPGSRRPLARRRVNSPVQRFTPRQLTLPLSPSILVREFHVAFNATIGSKPTVDLAADLIDLRLRLIDEEARELAEALSARDLLGVADALGDLVYVTFGAALAFGIDLDAVVTEIHRSNMTKLGSDGKPILRADGKVLKGPDYSPPHLQTILDMA
jgi:NTP pyrophosphatase (non-canonical NTP hydrolase)